VKNRGKNIYLTDTMAF